MPSENLVFELAEAPLASHAMVLHQCSKHGNPQVRARGGDTSLSAPLPISLQPYHPRPGAVQLNTRLKPMDAPTHHLESWQDGEDAGASSGSKILTGLQTHIPRFAASMGNLLQPQGDTHNDDSSDQRIVNIVTSLPFLAVGANMLRKHRTPEGREYAASMLAVGAAATLYHASSGKLRRICRKLDYWTIAVSSASMVKALYPEKPWLRRSISASLLAVPFKPFAVSAAHTLAMQVEFARQASAHAAIRPHFKKHVVAAAAGAVAFAVEDVLLDKGFGHVHAIWHLLAAAGVASTGPLVEHKERLRLDGDFGGTAAIKHLRPVHDSVASLNALGGSSPKGASPRLPSLDSPRVPGS